MAIMDMKRCTILFLAREMHGEISQNTTRISGTNNVNLKNCPSGYGGSKS